MSASVTDRLLVCRLMGRDLVPRSGRAEEGVGRGYLWPFEEERGTTCPLWIIKSSAGTRLRHNQHVNKMGAMRRRGSLAGSLFADTRRKNGARRAHQASTRQGADYSRGGALISFNPHKTSGDRIAKRGGRSAREKAFFSPNGVAGQKGEAGFRTSKKSSVGKKKITVGKKGRARRRDREKRTGGELRGIEPLSGAPDERIIGQAPRAEAGGGSGEHKKKRANAGGPEERGKKTVRRATLTHWKSRRETWKESRHLSNTTNIVGEERRGDAISKKKGKGPSRWNEK